MQVMHSENDKNQCWMWKMTIMRKIDNMGKMRGFLMKMLWCQARKNKLKGQATHLVIQRSSFAEHTFGTLRVSFFKLFRIWDEAKMLKAEAKMTSLLHLQPRCELEAVPTSSKGIKKGILKGMCRFQRARWRSCENSPLIFPCLARYKKDEGVQRCTAMYSVHSLHQTN